MVSAWPYLMESALACLESMVSAVMLSRVFLLNYVAGVYLYNAGAGKTTTFSILTGDLALTSGTAIIAGYDIRTNLRDVSVCYASGVGSNKKKSEGAYKLAR